MKANELRIGNYIKIENSSLDNQVEGLFLDHGQYFVDTNNFFSEDIKTIKPIPLTEDLLFKLGFKRRRLSYLYKINNITSLMLDYNSTYKNYFVILIQVKDKIHLPKIQHVHQLQNLYFALTGEELELLQNFHL